VFPCGSAVDYLSIYLVYEEDFPCYSKFFIEVKNQVSPELNHRSMYFYLFNYVVCGVGTINLSNFFFVHNICFHTRNKW
jgi:hypothetical protein